MNTKLYLAGAAAALVAGAAIAQPHMMMRADADNDGNLTLAEVNAEIDAHLARIDANGDGAVDAEERETAHAMMREMRAERRGAGDGEGRGEHRGHRGGRHGGPGGMLERMDADGDGRITRGELGARAEEHFARIDSDGNGVVTEAEREAAHAAMRERHQARRAQMIERFDADGDGELSAEEREAAHEARRAERRNRDN